MRGAILPILPFVLCGCATYAAIDPSVKGYVRLVEVSRPVVVSVLDGRAGTDINAVPRLQTSLDRMYKGSIERADYASAVERGDVAVKIRIIEIGSNLGTRIITKKVYLSTFLDEIVSAEEPWRDLAADCSSNRYLLDDDAPIEGWWVGIARIEAKVIDNRQEPPISFTIPLAGEQRRSNFWGHMSAEKSAKQAWNKVSAQLTGLLDGVIEVVKESDE